MSLIVKIILLGSAFLLSLPAAYKTEYFAHFNFDAILQLINGISSDLLKLLRNFNDTAILAFFKISLGSFGTGWAIVFPNNLVLYSKDLKLSVYSRLLLKLVASSFE